MTGHATQEADDDDFATGGIIILVLIFTLVVDACGVAFLYKVWNERQMTHEYARQADALERLADAAEGRARPALALVPLGKTFTLPTLGGTAVER